MTERNPDFAFEKKIAINESIYNNDSAIIVAIERLLSFMKETNQNKQLECRSFRLDCRPPFFDEQMPHINFVLDFKWGSKKEIEDSKC